MTEGIRISLSSEFATLYVCMKADPPNSTDTSCSLPLGNWNSRLELFQARTTQYGDRNFLCLEFIQNNSS